jgi:hypothetical protein
LSLDFDVEELKRSTLNLSEARAQLETKVLVYANPVKTIIKSRQTRMKRPSKYIRVCAWLDDRKTDFSEVEVENDRQSNVEEKPVPRRRARRIRLNWDPDGDKRGNRGSDAEVAHGPIITTFSSKSRRLHMK